MFLFTSETCTNTNAFSRARWSVLCAGVLFIYLPLEVWLTSNIMGYFCGIYCAHQASLGFIEF